MLYRPVHLLRLRAPPPSWRAPISAGRDGAAIAASSAGRSTILHADSVALADQAAWGGARREDPLWGCSAIPPARNRWDEFFRNACAEVASILASVERTGTPLRRGSALGFGCASAGSRRRGGPVSRLRGIDVAESGSQAPSAWPARRAARITNTRPAAVRGRAIRLHVKLSVIRAPAHAGRLASAVSASSSACSRRASPRSPDPVDPVELPGRRRGLVRSAAAHARRAGITPGHGAQRAFVLSRRRRFRCQAPRGRDAARARQRASSQSHRRLGRRGVDELPLRRRALTETAARAKRAPGEAAIYTR